MTKLYTIKAKEIQNCTYLFEANSKEEALKKYLDGAECWDYAEETINQKESTILSIEPTKMTQLTI